jgi:hypothetical protein
MSGKRRFSRPGLAVLAAGLLILGLGSGPLFVTIALAKLGVTDDPNPNPVLFGMMAMCTFWPGIGITLVGLWLTATWRKRERSDDEG